ncbi:MAG: hypothetical protein JW928_04210 [Candidatus Aureabacteria bacterium]|nr:hypothetical protein [Candidatus Auribacterota bacterium]
MVFSYLFIGMIVAVNISAALYESAFPHQWFRFIMALFNRTTAVRLYGVFLVFLSAYLAAVILRTDIIIRMKGLVWIIDFYIVFSAFLLLFFTNALKKLFHSFQDNIEPRVLRRALNLDSFLRLVASFILAASMIR